MHGDFKTWRMDDFQEQQDIQNANGMQQAQNDIAAIDSLNDCITAEIDYQQ